MSIVSYAQNFEDVLLWRALGHVEHGRYLDIGAQDPVVDSVSLAFYQAGWRGVHVEPIPFYAARLRDARPDETVIEAAVTDKNGPVTIYEIPETGLSTGNKDIAADHLKSGYENHSLVVPSIRLDELLGKAEDEIHWMKIDVEGMEDAVLRSWGKSPSRPWVLVIESTYPNSQKPMHQFWINEVLRRDYREVYFDGLSRFFVHRDHEALGTSFEGSPNVFDEFAIAPVHWAAREVDRTYCERLDKVSAEASQREAELRQGIDCAQAQATAAADAASFAVADRDQAREDALSAKVRLDAASRHHHEALAALAVEKDQLRSDASSASTRLWEAEREQRQALVQQWREWQVAEANFRIEARDREDELQAALRAATTSAASTQINLTEAHFAEIARLNEKLLTVAEQSHAERIEQDRALRGEHDQVLGKVRRQAHDEWQALNGRLQSTINESDANAVAANIELSRLQERAAEIEFLLDQAEEASALAAERFCAEREQNCKERDDARAEAAWLKTEVAQASSEREDARAEAAWLRTEVTQASSEREEARAEAAWLRTEVAQAIRGREELREVAEQSRAAAEQADTFMRTAIVAHSGLWHRIGDALGLTSPLPVPPNADESLLIIPPRTTATPISQSGQESEPTMPNLVLPTGGNPYLAARSLTELLSWHDVDFVRCAFVTILGRQPDAHGEAYYTNRIRRGDMKMEVLRELRRSPEALSHDPGIAGLDRALKKGAAFRAWGLGWLAPEASSNSRSNRLVRSISNTTALLDRNNQVLALVSEQLLHQVSLNFEAERRQCAQEADATLQFNQLLKSIGDAAELLDRNHQVMTDARTQFSIYMDSIAQAERRRSEEQAARSAGARDHVLPITIEQLLEIAGGA